MNRLQSELHRLYAPLASAKQSADTGGSRLPAADTSVRAAVLTLARPADWEAIAKVWRGVQTDLGLPAPAIAVSGIDGYQLWFSFAEPVTAAQAAAFTDALRTRYLCDIAPQRTLDAGTLPPYQTKPGHWSAFVAPDLAPVFADEPWLDIPPNLDGQADLLGRLESIASTDFLAALQRLEATDVQAHTTAAPGTHNIVRADAALDPRSFLLKVMHDETVALGLRIEAAKALLPGSDEQGRR